MLTSDIDVDRSIVTFRNEDGKTELTISTAPLSTVEATPAAHLIPPPGAKAETALKQTAEIITSLTNTNSYIHIDFPDVISICASAAIRIIRFNAGDDPSKAFSDALAAQGINPSCCDRALINIGAPANIGLAKVTSLVTIVQEAVQDDALIICGLALDPQQKRHRNHRHPRKARRRDGGARKLNRAPFVGLTTSNNRGAVQNRQMNCPLLSIRKGLYQ